MDELFCCIHCHFSNTNSGPVNVGACTDVQFGRSPAVVLQANGLSRACAGAGFSSLLFVKLRQKAVQQPARGLDHFKPR